MKPIYTGTYSEAMIISNLLESRGIAVYTTNETMSIIEPVAVGAGGFNTVTISVDEVDYEKSAELLQSYHRGDLELDQ